MQIPMETILIGLKEDNKGSLKWHERYLHKALTFLAYASIVSHYFLILIFKVSNVLSIERIVSI